MSYLDFFENTPAQDDIFNMSQEDLETTKDIFLENQRLNNFLYNYA
ncbi:MAG: hypothetical protein LBC61_06905 [Candidatus Peribacteria bacterium]|jgi:hypothetical protein|nr:hypothetical protein [Candidatus Peribacteria bacterium]